MSGFSHRSGGVSGSDETSAAKKRVKRSANEKQRMVEASLKAGTSVKAVAEAHGLHPTQLYRWRRLYGRKLEGKSEAALLPVRLAEESGESRQPAGKPCEDSEGTRPTTIYVEFTSARVRIESADRATVLAVLERLAR